MSFVKQLQEVVGGSQVLEGADVVAGYVTDWTGRWSAGGSVVVRPGSVAEVGGVVDVCRANGVPLVPQGGNTGLVGGSVPHHGEVVLSLRRLDRVGEIDMLDRSVIAGAGVTIGVLQRHVRQVGLDYGVDFAARDSATVGGTIATNAGGVRVIANGDTRRQVLGLEAVRADGSVVSSLSRLEKATMGPDPLQLLVGSEGTLGVITAARLKLTPRRSGETYTTLVAVERLADGLSLKTDRTRALEFFDQVCLDRVVDELGLSRPLPPSPFYVLVESDELPELPESVEAVVDPRLWTYRESITESLNSRGVPNKLDVAIPKARLDQFVSCLAELDIEGDIYLFGHLAEGNFHVNVLGDPDPEMVTNKILKAVVSVDGAIASEHGIGVAKGAWWHRVADPSNLILHHQVRTALDPDRIFNPAVL